MTIKQLYPTQRPALDLNFARQKRLDSRVTFTRASTGTYVGSDGLIKTAADNEARFDHDPATGESLGLLIEESRTNYFQYSGELNNAYWDLATGLTKTANNAVSPDGSITALLVTEDTSTGEHVFGKTANVSVSNNCMGIFVKPNGKTRVGFRQGAESYANVVFDLTGPGSVVSGNGFIEQYPNGCHRFTQYRAGAVNKTIFHLLNDADNALSYTGDGASGCWIWGYQKEAGSFPTSYIPTTSSTVTRSADVASMTGTNFSSWYNQSEGTVFCDVITRCPFGGGNSASNVGVSFVLSDGNSNNIIYVQRPAEGSARGDNFQPTIKSSGSTVLNVEVTDAWPANVPNRQIIAYKVNDFNYSVNGVVGSPVTTGAAPSGIDRLDIGQLSFATYNRIKAGTFSRIAYYPTRLSDTQLQALTL